MTLHRCRPVRLGRIGVALVSDTSTVARRFDQLFAALPDAPTSATTAEVPEFWRTLDVRVSRTSGEARSAARLFDLSVGDRSIVRTSPLWRVEDALLERLNRWILDFNASSVHLHGALVSRAGQGVLLTGTSGSGKSTLTAALVRDGWTYHSDETVEIHAGGNELSALPRPLTLKRDSWPLFESLPSVPGPEKTPTERQRAHVPPAELGDASSAVVRATLVAFLSRDGCSASHAPMSSPEAFEQLVANTLDLERTALPGYQTLARLSSTVPAVRFQSADLATSPSLIRRCVDGAARSLSEGLPLEVQAPGEKSARRRGHGFDFGGAGGVLVEVESGKVLRLNASGFAAWAGLDGSVSADGSAEVRAMDDPFGQSLIDAGFASGSR